MNLTRTRSSGVQARRAHGVRVNLHGELGRTFAWGECLRPELSARSRGPRINGDCATDRGTRGKRPRYRLEAAALRPKGDAAGILSAYIASGLRLAYDRKRSIQEVDLIVDLFSPKHLLIVLVIVLLVFGTKKLKTIGSDLGGAFKGFKEAMKDGEHEGDEAAKPQDTKQLSGTEKPVEPQRPAAAAATATAEKAADKDKAA